MVFVDQRRHIGDSAQRKQVEMFFEIGKLVRVPACVQQSPANAYRQFEHDANAAQKLERVVAFGLMRIQHRQRIGQSFHCNLMMVRDDDFHADLVGVRHLRQRGDSGIRRNHQLTAARLNGIQRLIVEAVAFFHTIGQIIIKWNVQLPEEMHHQRGGGHPIHIIIAIDRGFFPVLDSLHDAPDSHIHAPHQKRIMNGIQLRIQKKTGRIRISQAAVDHQLGE